MIDGRLAGYLSARVSLIADATPGTGSARALADLTDTAVSALAEAAFASLQGNWALVALGGYGSRRLLPFSDLDLLVIADADGPDVARAAQQLLYPLWDAGFEVGHAVRSRKEHRRACRIDIETLTASLTARCLAGDGALAEETLAGVLKDARRRIPAMLRALDARPRPGSPYDLWPDLKEGAGGQRDIDELVWRSAVSGVAVPADLSAEQDIITAERWRLHAANGRKTARLTPDDDRQGLERLHEALASVQQALMSARGEPQSDAAWSASGLLDALGAGSSRLPSLERAAQSGALDDLVPGISALMTLRRPALTHRLTVGAHTLRAASLIAEHRTSDRLASALIETSADPRALYAAVLAHDAGKSVEGPGHPERGVPVARKVALALGADTAIAADAELLVREHLLLAETAAYRDIDDEDVVLECAARVGRRGLVGPLYLLTLVDSVATGPEAWDEWHASLVRVLAGRVDAALAPEIDGAGMVSSSAEVRASARTLLSHAPASVLEVLDRAPVRYLCSRTPADVAADMNALAGLGPRGAAHPFDIRLDNGQGRDTYRVTVATYDRAGLFALIAGSLSLSGLDILAAEANAGSGDFVLDTFTVRSGSLAPVEHATWARFERTLAAALAGHLDIAARLEQRRHTARARVRVRTRVEVSTANPMATTLTVRSSDRPGLLYDIADAIAREGMRIVWAKASVSDGAVTDTFRLHDAQGLPPRDTGELGHLSMRVREVLRRR